MQLQFALATMLMPRLANAVVIGCNQPPDYVQLPGCAAMVCGQFDGVQPEFASPLFAPDMDVHRLITSEAVEEESVRSRDVFDSRHSPTLPRSLGTPTKP